MVNLSLHIENELKYPGVGVVEYNVNVEGGFIKELSLTGDFFGEGEIRELEEKILNSKHDENDLNKVLSKVNIDDYIKGLSKESFIEGIMNIERVND